VKQLQALEARRRVLLERCEQQRVDLSYRFERISPGHQLSELTSRAQGLRRSGLAPPLLFWGATILATVVLLRPGKLLGKVAWLTSMVTLAGKATHLLRLVGQFRELRSLFRPGPG
jgi:hypothetical protein